jgi:hypothetical protein
VLDLNGKAHELDNLYSSKGASAGEHLLERTA